MTAGKANYYPQDPKAHNKRLFARIHAELASDDSTIFINAATKLTKFLSKIDAYYPEAHSLILKSLETARETLTRLCNSSVLFHCSQPFPENLRDRRLAYKALVETVVKFSAQFGQVGTAHETLKQLALSVQSSDEAIALSTSPEQGVLHESRASIQGHVAGATQQSLPLVSSTSSKEPPNPVLPPDTISSVSQSDKSISNLPGGAPASRRATSPPVTPVPTPRSAGEMVAPSATSGDVHNITPTQGLSAAGGSIMLTSRAKDTTSGGSTSTSATVKPKRKPKLNAKKQPLPKAVVQDDFKYWKEKQGAAGRVAAPITSLTTIDATTPGAALQEPAIQVMPNSLEADSGRTSGKQNTTNSSKQPSKLDEDVIMIDRVVKTPEVIDLTSEDIQVGSNAGTDAHENANVLAPGTTMSGTASSTEPRDLDEPMDIEECDVNLPLNQLVRQQTMDNSLSRVTTTVEKNDTLLEKDDIAGRQTHLPGVQSLADYSSAAEVQDHHISKETTPIIAVEDGPNDTEMRSPTSGEQSRPQSTTPKVKSPGPSFEPRTNGGDITDANGKDAQVGGSTERESEETRSLSPPIVSVFEPQTVGLVSYNLGQTTGDVITIEFEVASGMETLVTLWKTRFNHDYDLTHGSCLSLACYRLDQITDAGIDIKDTDDSGVICKAFLSVRPSWPNNGTLRAKIGNKYIFLSPPYNTTGDSFVDLAPYVDGRNLLIKLEHAGDLRSYVFALFAHPPTLHQLRDLRSRRKKDEQWKTALQSIARPFTKQEIDNS